MITGCGGCNRVQPNFEGVLMQNYGRNNIKDFKLVTGAQGWLWMGESLYQVPMYQQAADPEKIEVTTSDAGVFTVDPSYTYHATRGEGVNIIFNYKHVGIGDPDEMMDNIEAKVLNKLALNAYREEARTFTTDSIMKSVNVFEKQVEDRLKKEFATAYFTMENLTSGLKPPTSMAEAIEHRNNAIQQAEQVKNELEIARMKLEKDRIEAEGNRVKATGLDAKIMTEKWIEAIRNTQNKVIITDGKTPMILNP